MKVSSDRRRTNIRFISTMTAKLGDFPTWPNRILKFYQDRVIMQVGAKSLKTAYLVPFQILVRADNAISVYDFCELYSGSKTIAEIQGSLNFFDVLIKIVCSICLVANVAIAQNLVKNSDFEEYDRCPNSWSVYPPTDVVRYWKNPSKGTPDYFNACSYQYCGVPKNWAGIAKAYTGDAYVGLYLWQNDDSNYREYIETEFSEPLTRGRHEVSVSVLLSSNSTFGIDRIGILITDTIIMVDNDRVINIIPNIAIISDSSTFMTSNQWRTINVFFDAKGGERFLTIGNFWNNKVTRALKVKDAVAANTMLAKHSYYYFDHVTVVKKETDEGLKTFPKNNRYVLSDLNFNFESYELLASGYPLLDSVCNILDTSPQSKVFVDGYTDDFGSTNYNIKLSLKRAESVLQYLISKGIQSERISLRGLGEDLPYTENDTEEGRAKNRRVELTIIE